MAKSPIPAPVSEEAARMIDRFNKKLAKTGYRYVPRFKGKFLYLDRDDSGTVGPICRLEYLGGKRGWSFAIYKYSDDCYDADEWMFPGSECVDGTIEGAMKAGMQAYP
jgi:hypothetical protein